MDVWYVGIVWACGTCGGRGSGVVDNCVWTLVSTSNVKGFGAIGAIGATGSKVARRVRQVVRSS